MSEPGGIGPAHIAGWIVTALAFGGTMVWNYLNRLHANSLARKIRSDQYEKEIWDRHRNRIEERLEEFVSFVTALPAQVMALHKDDDKPLSLDIWSVNLNIAHDGLARALHSADRSIYCHGDGWSTKGFGVLHDNETSWDLILGLMEKAQRCRKKSTQLAPLKLMQALVLEIEVEVRTEVQSCDYQYQPNP